MLAKAISDFNYTCSSICIYIANRYMLKPMSHFQVNNIAFHPVHGTLGTVGSDGRFSFWDKDARTKLKTSEQLDQPISSCAFNAQGSIFAYSSSYDWSKVIEHLPYDLSSSPIFLGKYRQTCLERPPLVNTKQ